ncbi:MAG: carbon storage regulator [Oscillibacter sp.]|nr:carbon storage regulator [Oscillibacter sp.]
MLILQRKPGESLLIGDNVEVTVVSVEPGGRVRLAIQAPRELAILRSELKGAIDTNREAAEEAGSPAELMELLYKGKGGRQA